MGECNFIYNSLGCPIVWYDNTKHWCSLKTDSNGHHVSGKENYGFCENHCPKHYDNCENIDNPSSGPELAILRNTGNIQIPENVDLSTQTAAVGCCSMNGDDCIRRPDCSTKTFDEAKKKCEDIGRRLCTLLEYSSCCGKGCGFDAKLAWHIGDDGK